MVSIKTKCKERIIKRILKYSSQSSGSVEKCLICSLVRNYYFLGGGGVSCDFMTHSEVWKRPDSLWACVSLTSHAEKSDVTAWLCQLARSDILSCSSEAMAALAWFPMIPLGETSRPPIGFMQVNLQTLAQLNAMLRIINFFCQNSCFLPFNVIYTEKISSSTV